MTNIITQNFSPSGVCAVGEQSCTINIEFDADNPIYTPIATSYDHICSIHFQSVLQTVLSEEFLIDPECRNIILETVKNIAQIDSNGDLTFKDGYSMNWSWDGVLPNRIVNIHVQSPTGTNALTDSDIVRVQHEFDKRLGVGKATIS